MAESYTREILQGKEKGQTSETRFKTPRNISKNIHSRGKYNDILDGKNAKYCKIVKYILV